MSGTEILKRYRADLERLQTGLSAENTEGLAIIAQDPAIGVIKIRLDQVPTIYRVLNEFEQALRRTDQARYAYHEPALRKAEEAYRSHSHASFLSALDQVLANLGEDAVGNYPKAS